MIIHIVTQGETIWSIAEEYGVSPERIISDNGLAGLEFLIPGQAILILIPTQIYTVSEGDTIFSISQRFGITPLELVQRNISLAVNPVLYPGQQLTISFENEGSESIYIYGYIYPYVRNNVLLKEAPYLSSCAIFSYGFRDDGSLIEIDDSKFINILNQFDVIPIMLLSSINTEGRFDSDAASRLFNDAELQSKVIDNMLVVMNEKGYKGVDIDFEYVNSEDGEAFVNFVTRVTETMNRNGYTVNVDLAPKTSEAQEGLLYEGHNYRELGNAANTVLLMTYEWGYTYGPPMAVSPINQVRRVVEFAVSQIDNNKIYMGIPNYGYDWRLPYEKGVTKATSIGNEEALRIASQYGVSIQYDEQAQSPFFEYVAEDGAEHIVWFEDVRSIQAKYALIEEFNLRGGGYWNLMRPFSQNWAYVGYNYRINKE